MKNKRNSLVNNSQQTSSGVIEYCDSLITIKSFKCNQHKKWMKAIELSWKKYYKENYDKKNEQSLFSNFFHMIKKCAMSAYSKVNLDSVNVSENESNITKKTKNVPNVSSRVTKSKTKYEKETSITSYNNNNISRPIEIELLSECHSSFSIETSKPINDTSKKTQNKTNKTLYKRNKNYSSTELYQQNSDSIKDICKNYSIKPSFKYSQKPFSEEYIELYKMEKDKKSNTLNNVNFPKTKTRLSQSNSVSFGSSEDLYKKNKRYHKDLNNKRIKKGDTYTKKINTSKNNDRVYKYEFQCLW